MLELSEKVFLSVLQSQVLTALARVEAPPRNLSPTPAVSHMLVVMTDILTIASSVEDHEGDMKKVTIVVSKSQWCGNHQNSFFRLCHVYWIQLSVRLMNKLQD